MKTTKRLRSILGLKKTIKPEIIILGDAKSGTTAATRLIAAYSGLTVCADVPKLWSPINTKLWNGELLFKDFYESNKKDFSFQILKEPNLTFIWPQLKSVFPTSSFVMVLRSPHSLIKSQLSRIKLDGKENYKVNDVINSVPKAWQPLLSCEYLEKKSDYVIELMALKWNYVVNLYLENKDEMLLFYYDEFVNDKKAYLNKLLSQLKLDIMNDRDDLLNFQFQPKGSSLTSKEFFSQDNYDKISHLTEKARIELKMQMR